MTTKKEFVYLVGGIGIGVYVPRLLPKLKPVKLAVYFKEVLSARMRLQKIVVEEYERIDEAIEAEEAFLRMIRPQLKNAPQSVTFDVRDEGGQRGIKLNINYKPD